MVVVGVQENIYRKEVEGWGWSACACGSHFIVAWLNPVLFLITAYFMVTGTIKYYVSIYIYIYNIYKYIYICLNLRTIISKLIMKQTSFVMADYCDICNMRICNAQTSEKNKNCEGYRFSDLIKRTQLRSLYFLSCEHEPWLLNKMV